MQPMVNMSSKSCSGLLMMSATNDAALHQTPPTLRKASPLLLVSCCCFFLLLTTVSSSSISSSISKSNDDVGRLLPSSTSIERTATLDNNNVVHDEVQQQQNERQQEHSAAITSSSSAVLAIILQRQDHIVRKLDHLTHKVASIATRGDRKQQQRQQQKPHDDAHAMASNDLLTKEHFDQALRALTQRISVKMNEKIAAFKEFILDDAFDLDRSLQNKRRQQTPLKKDQTKESKLSYSQKFMNKHSSLRRHRRTAQTVSNTLPSVVPLHQDNSLDESSYTNSVQYQPDEDSNYDQGQTSSSGTAESTQFVRKSSFDELLSLVRWLVRKSHLSYTSQSSLFGGLLRALNLRHNLLEENLLEALTLKSDGLSQYLDQREDQMVQRIVQENSANITEVILASVNSATQQVKTVLTVAHQDYKNASQDYLSQLADAHDKLDNIGENMKILYEEMHDDCQKRTRSAEVQSAGITYVNPRTPIDVLLNLNSDVTTHKNSYVEHASLNKNKGVLPSYLYYNLNYTDSFTNDPYILENILTREPPIDRNNMLRNHQTENIPEPSLVSSMSEFPANEDNLFEDYSEMSTISPLSLLIDIISSGDSNDNDTTENINETNDVVDSTTLSPLNLDYGDVSLINTAKLNSQSNKVNVSQHNIMSSLNNTSASAPKISKISDVESSHSAEFVSLLRSLLENVFSNFSQQFQVGTSGSVVTRLEGLKERIHGLKIYLDTSVLRLRHQLEEAIVTSEGALASSLLPALTAALQETVVSARDQALQVSDAAVTSVSSAAVATGRHTTEQLTKIIEASVQQLAQSLQSDIAGCPELYSRVSSMCLYVPEIAPPIPYFEMSPMDGLVRPSYVQHPQQTLYKWSQARTICRSYNGDLAVIPNTNDLSQILRSLRHASDGGFWLGAKAKSSLVEKFSGVNWFTNVKEYNNKLKWVTGEYSKLTIDDLHGYNVRTVREFSEPSYNNPDIVYEVNTVDMDTNEINTAYNTDTFLCLLLLKEGTFRLVLEHCDAKHRPVCQYLPSLAS